MQATVSYISYNKAIRRDLIRCSESLTMVQDGGVRTLCRVERKEKCQNEEVVAIDRTNEQEHKKI
jgi:hypothetical protein